MAANRDPRAPRDSNLDHDTARLRGWIDLAVGLALVGAGAILFAVTHSGITRSSPTHFVSYALVIAGGSTALRGIWRLVAAPLTGAAPMRLEVRGLGYKSFVAWRYLLVAKTKVSRRTKRLLLAGFTARVLVSVLVAAGVGPDGPAGLHNPMWLLQLATLVFLFGVILIGVLGHSKVSLITFGVGIVIIGVSVLGGVLVTYGKLPFIELDPDQATLALQILNVAAIFGAVLAALAMFFGSLRAFFTFFTTVPIGGVWIGTSALVMVLAVMSGFESDLRDKILGSNAHLQIAREDGDFVEWREVKAKIDKIPGVVASTPFAVSEVVVAANNQPQNVIIKGIDPKTVGGVTDLVSDIEGDPDAIKRLDPIIDDSHDLRVPQRPWTGTTVDPAPDDLPTPGAPIDFSGDSADAGSAGSAAVPDHDAGQGRHHAGSAAPGSAAPGSAAPGSAGEVEPPEPFGGDAQQVRGRPDRRQPAVPATVIDPPPPDLVQSDDGPADYSRPDYVPDSVVKVIDVPFDSPAVSRRTQALPGILVGKELVKQTHLYVGQEVRVVSPLSDPANPDATGTPIPFNRDYRVAGKFFTGMYEYDLKYVYVTLGSLQEFLDRGDTVDGIEVRVSNPDDTDAFVAKFQATFGPHYRVQDWKELNRSLFSALKLEKIAMFLVLGIVILVASFSIIGNLIMVVVEKAREIALLKTLGASDIGVMQLFAIQGLMIGLIGTVLGIATGLLGCWGAKRYGLPLNPDVYYIDKMPIHVDPASVLAAASAGILISIAATIYPAVVAARVRPAAGMRH
jgi:lipoprotein-releasing system permease protein